jgi:hypothetical protein
MNNELLTLKRNAVMLGLCDGYKVKWNEAKGKKDLVDMALDANGVEFMAKSIAEGWGLSKRYILGNFGDYMNNNYVRDKGGYTSKLYVDYGGDIFQPATLNLLVGCNTSLLVPEGSVCKIYVCGRSNVRINCVGKCYVYVYGGYNDVKYSGDVTVEEIAKPDEPNKIIKIWQ